MRSIGFNRKLAAAAFGLLLAGSAVAEETATDDERYGRTLNVKQRADFGQATVNELGDRISKLQQMVDAAEAANDVVKLNCLSTEMTKLEALVQPAATAKGALDGSIANENRDLQEFNFNKLYVARAQGSDAFAAAESCVGKDGGVPGKTNVVVRVQGNQSGSNASDYGSASDSSTRPPDASSDGS